MANVAMLGTGFIGDFYTYSLHGKRNRDRVITVWSRNEERGKAFARKHGIPKWTTSMEKAVGDLSVDLVVVALPNHLHKEAVLQAVHAGKGVLCTKPLGRNANEALAMLEAVEKAGVFYGYLEDLVYTPKTLKALDAVKNGAVGKVIWARSR
mgnify:FL=1